jgi:hypothetical protein
MDAAAMAGGGLPFAKRIFLARRVGKDDRRAFCRQSCDCLIASHLGMSAAIDLFKACAFRTKRQQLRRSL